MNIKKLLMEWNLWLLIILLIASIMAIHPFTPTNGVIIEGVRSPAPSTLKAGYVITELNGKIITNLTDYNSAYSQIKTGDVIRISYREEISPYYYVTREAPAFIATERENKTSLGLIVGDAPSNNLDYGLEIVGGTKLLLTPNRTLTNDEAENLVSILSQRLNLFGLKEVPVNFISDFSGNQYIRIEFSGANEEDIRILLEKEGNFEGKIKNTTVFTGSEIVDVCISGVQCTMRIQPVYTGTEANTEIMYQFEFQIDLTQEAAQRFADVTNNLSIGECSTGGCYLESNLELSLDGELIQDGSLRLPESVKGEVLTSARITGMRATMKEAQDEMRKLQAILQSRSLPVKLTIARIESLSPAIGEGFASNIATVFITAIITVALVIGLRYKNFKVSLPIISIVIIEVISTLGISSIINITLDFPAIAGIMASIGTCLNDQIIITDEILKGERKKEETTVKKRIKNAFLVIVAAFMTSFVSMIPLTFSTAGLLKGFAITTIISITIGIVITRRAYARICEIIFKD